jgi:protein-tyrosine-phosphatase
MVTVLFVCTGNTFRSASAEYLLRAHASKEGDLTLTVFSAGTKGNPLGSFEETYTRLDYYGVDMRPHKFQVLTQEHFDKADIVICFAKHHQQYIKQTFGFDSFLFNTIAIGESTDLQDDGEAHIWQGDPRFEAFVKRTVDMIAKRIPAVYDFVINQ